MATKQKGVIHPYFQAIGWLEGQLAEKEAGCYQFVTVDGLSLNAIARRKMKKMLRERPELLGADRPWTVYPKTDRQGHLNSVHITGLGGYSRMGGQVDAFYISGRVSIPVQEAGQITVKIQPNRPRERNKFVVYSHKICEANFIENILLKNMDFRGCVLNKGSAF